MKKVIFLILLIAYSLEVLAQQKHLDSLLLQLERHVQADTVRINLLNEISYTYSGIDPSEGINAAREAIELAGQLSAESKLPVSYSHLGVNYRASGQDSQALDAMQKSLNLYREQGNKLGIARLLNNMALVYYNLSDYGKALQYHDQAAEIFEEMDYRYGLMHTYNNIGVVHLAWSDYPQALDAFLDAHRLVSSADGLMLGNILSNIGLVYKNLADFDQATAYQEQALNLYRAMDNKTGTARALANMATLYDLTGEPERSIAYYEQALAINMQMGDWRRIASDYTNLGVVYRGLGDYAKALDNLMIGLEHYRKTTDKTNTALNLLELAQVLAEADGGIMRKKGFDPARRDQTVLDYQVSALKLAEESGSLQQQQHAWMALYETYENQANIPKALGAFKRQVALKDSIFNNEKQREIIQKQAQFDYEKKEALLTAAFEQEKALAQAELHRQKIIRNFGAGGFIFCFLVATGGYILYKKKRDAEQMQQESEFQIKVAEVEMKALRAQLNPHFIFNSLNSISSFMLKNDLRAADYYLAKFAKLMRLILEKTALKEIPLEDDLQLLTMYMELESARMDGGFVYEIQVEPTIDCENTLVPPLMLQPFVENSIWHGFANLNRQGRVLIRIVKEWDQLHFVVEDNGVGRKPVPLVESNRRTSMGVRITQERLEIIRRTKKHDANMALVDLPEGLRVELTLPLTVNFGG